MSSKAIKKISIGFAGLVCALFVTLLMVSRQGFASVLIGFSDFDEMAPNVYVEPGMPSSDLTLFLVLYKEARERISTTYGEFSARPVIVVGHSEKMLRYGNGYGSSHFLPGKAYVVIGRNGQNVDVIAHELAHAELAHRVGYWKRLTQIPAWFEEGIAMQVDHRKPFDIENFRDVTPTNRDKLWWQAQFNSGGGDTVTFNYALSKEIVRAWRLGHQQSRPYVLMNEISRGRAFEDAFAETGSKS